MRENAAIDFRVGWIDDNGDGPFLGSESPQGRFQVVFEDDGATGYFYALDTSIGDQPVVDAVHIYDVEQVTDRDRPSRVSIGWSSDGLASGLFINGRAHAVFDFDQRRGWCRTAFPPPSPTGAWPQDSHAWDAETESVLKR